VQQPDLQYAGPEVEQVRALGTQVALEDFGAGMSSFGEFKSLPVNTLKIDGQFARELLEDPLDPAAVRSFLGVAEFVETQEVHGELRRRADVQARVRTLIGKSGASKLPTRLNQKLDFLQGAVRVDC
jgi:predicted signal transduction protein with EAL and GGDEF domain